MQTVARLFAVLALVFWIPVLAVLCAPFYATLLVFWVLLGLDRQEFRLWGVRITNYEKRQ